MANPCVTSTRALLVSEVVTNAVVHASVAGDSEIAFEVATVAGTLWVEDTDRGPGFVPERRRVDQDEGSGWGLYIVD